MRLTIEIERVDGVHRARMTRGTSTWERVLGKSAVRYLLYLTDHIQGTIQAHNGGREAVWRALIGRNGVVTVDDLANELTISRNHAMAILRKAMVAGKLRRLSRADGTIINDRYELTEST